MKYTLLWIGIAVGLVGIAAGLLHVPLLPQAAAILLLMVVILLPWWRHSSRP
jgi:hypothetical protein